jgi:hypothetical protein
MNKEKLNFILDQCRIMVTNASDPFVAQALLPYGYTPNRLQQGMALYEKANGAFKTQQKEYTEQYYATSAFVSAFEVEMKSFANYVKIARIAFKDNIEGSRLLPLSAKIKSYSEFKAKASAFYTIVKEPGQLLDLLSVYGITGQQLALELDNLANLEQLNQKQFVETGEAQAATEERNRNLEELREYCSALRTVAKIALADQPQQLEKLGIIARNGAKQKAPAATPEAEPKN